MILIQLGREFGVLATAGLVLGTGFAGAVLARAEGMRTLRGMRRELAAGRVPGREMLDGLAVLVGGALLLTPGLITDLAGLALLVPVSRRGLQALARAWFERQLRKGALQVSALQWQGGGRPPPSGHRPPGLDPRHEIQVPPPEERR